MVSKSIKLQVYNLTSSLTTYQPSLQLTLWSMDLFARIFVSNLSVYHRYVANLYVYHRYVVNLSVYHRYVVNLSVYHRYVVNPSVYHIYVFNISTIWMWLIYLSTIDMWLIFVYHRYVVNLPVYPQLGKLIYALNIVHGQVLLILSRVLFIARLTLS